MKKILAFLLIFTLVTMISFPKEAIADVLPDANSGAVVWEQGPETSHNVSLSQTPWNLIRGMATPKQPVSHQATPSIDQSPVSVNRARFIFSEGICL